jgi:hypothetical protein
MNRMDTSNLPSTDSVETTVYWQSFFEIINTEFPGPKEKEEDDKKFELMAELIKIQDIFIYVHDLNILEPTLL